MKGKKRFVTIMLLIIGGMAANAQDFWGEDFDGHEGIFALKWSQLYYEVMGGYNVLDDYEQASFVYFSMGVGFPSQTNAWRKFLPQQQKPSNEEEAALYGSMNTDNVYAGKIAVGAEFYFTPSIGMYIQAGWGFLSDLGSPSDDTSTSVTDNSKKTFIYNTCPVELGLSMRFWKGLHLQGGVTYMWKEIPLLTVGLGIVF